MAQRVTTSRPASRWLKTECSLALLCLAMAGGAHAEFTAITSGGGQYEYNSNIYDLANGSAVPGTHDFQHSDNNYAATGSFLGSFLHGLQDFYTQLNGTEDRYDHFTQLNHSEYKLDAGWNWRINRNLYGTLEVDHSRSTSPFIDVGDASFAYLTETKELGSMGYQFAKNWRFEATALHLHDDTPFVNEPDLKLNESAGTTSMKYVGSAGLTAGVSFGYTSADFEGGDVLVNQNQSGSYTQTTGSLVASYKATGRSVFSGSVGYSHQASANKFNAYSGGTGNLDYKYDFTPKTSIALDVARNISSSGNDLGVTNTATNGTGTGTTPVGTGTVTPPTTTGSTTVLQANGALLTGSEVDTSGTVTVSWEPIRKLDVGLAYTYTHQQFPNQGMAVGSSQINHVQYATLRCQYRPVYWLSISPYVKYLTRSSTFVDGDFNSKAVGIYVIASRQDMFGR